MKLCLHTNSIIEVPIQEQAKLIKEAGFDSVMLFWYKDLQDTPVDDFPQIVRNAGLEIENIHLPWYRPNDLWRDNLDGDEALIRILQYLEAAKAHQINTAVMHPIGWQGEPPFTEVGLNRFQKMVDIAEKNNINLALENLSNPNVLDFIYSKIDSNKLKFCYDNGHDNIFPQGYNLVIKYRDRISACHLTDNN